MKKAKGRYAVLRANTAIQVARVRPDVLKVASFSCPGQIIPGTRAKGARLRLQVAGTKKARVRRAAAPGSSAMPQTHVQLGVPTAQHSCSLGLITQPTNVNGARSPILAVGITKAREHRAVLMARTATLRTTALLVALLARRFSSQETTTRQTSAANALRRRRERGTRKMKERHAGPPASIAMRAANAPPVALKAGYSTGLATIIRRTSVENALPPPPVVGKTKVKARRVVTPGGTAILRIPAHRGALTAHCSLRLEVIAHLIRARFARKRRPRHGITRGRARRAVALGNTAMPPTVAVPGVLWVPRSYRQGAIIRSKSAKNVHRSCPAHGKTREKAALVD